MISYLKKWGDTVARTKRTDGKNARTVASNKWQKENCDRINLTLPKGKKAEIKCHADSHKESVNGFIKRAINETMERDNINLRESEDTNSPDSE